MKGYVANIEKLSLENENFRKVLYTAKNSQLVVMSLQPNEDIGEEIHQLDQFIRCEEGVGKAVLDGVYHDLKAGFVVVVPAGARHNVINTSKDVSLKLYTLYSPPNHKDGTVHITKQDAEADEGEHFDGKTSEVSGLGILFAGYFTVPEVTHIFSGTDTYSLGLPTCAYGLIFYIIIFVLAVSYLKTNKTQIR